MTTDPKPDADRPAPATDEQPDRQNGQGAHHGVPHSPDDFDALNPAKLKRDPDDKV